MNNFHCLAVLALLVFSNAYCARAQAPAPGTHAPRVVSLAPNITEIICAIGAEKTLAGRTSACDYPPGVVKNIPVVGGFGAPSMEALLKAGPTVVLDVDLEEEAVAGLIKGYGIKYMRVPCSRLADIPGAIRIIGRITGHETRAEEAAKEFERRTAELRAAGEKSAPAAARPAVFVEIWSDPLMTAGGGSLINDLINLAGGRNIAGEIKKEYFAVSAEWVINRDPDIIICLGSSSAEAVSARAGWSNLKAVRSGRVFTGLNNDLIQRAGPRALEGAVILKDCISGRKTP
jgi:iron complex transport system substrate-binding protein